MEGSLEDAARARLEDRDLVRMFQEVESLPEEDRMVVKKLLDAFLTKKQIQALAQSWGESPCIREKGIKYDFSYHA